MAVSPSRKSYYDSAAWQRLREETFRRDGYRCARCKCLGRQAGGTCVLNAAHIVSRAKGGLDVLANLRTMCRSCHRRHDAAGHRAERPARCSHGAAVCRYCGFKAPEPEPVKVTAPGRCPHGELRREDCWSCAGY